MSVLYSGAMFMGIDPTLGVEFSQTFSCVLSSLVGARRLIHC